MNPEIVNIYIEKLLNEVQELTKTRLLLETQIKYTEMLNSQFQMKLQDVENQLEKQNKKKSKEVDTSENF